MMVLAVKMEVLLLTIVVYDEMIFAKCVNKSLYKRGVEISWILHT